MAITHYCYNGYEDFKRGFYQGAREFAIDNVVGRVCGLPIVVIEGVLDVIFPFTVIIERVILVFANLFSSPSSDYTFKDALRNMELGLEAFASIPVKVIMAPFKISYQALAILIDPMGIRPF